MVREFLPGTELDAFETEASPVYEERSGGRGNTGNRRPVTGSI